MRVCECCECAILCCINVRIRIRATQCYATQLTPHAFVKYYKKWVRGSYVEVLRLVLLSGYFVNTNTNFRLVIKLKQRKKLQNKYEAKLISKSIVCCILWRWSLGY